MALVEPGMLCSLCREPTDDPDRDTFATCAHAELHFHSQFALLNDAAVHQHCIDDWALRDDFIAHYNLTICDELLLDDRGHVRYRSSRLSEVWRRLTSENPGDTEDPGDRALLLKWTSALDKETNADSDFSGSL